MDKIIFLCIHYFTHKGFKFLEFNGSSVKVELDGDEYFWYPSTPYKMRHKQKWKEVDGFNDITKLKQHKLNWKIKCNKELEELLTRDCKFTYQIQVDTQNLDSHSKDVTDFLNNYQILKISSPMATRKSNIIGEVVSQAHKNNQRVLFITNRVSLSVDIADKYGIPHYQRNDYITGNSLVVQFDSLYKFVSELEMFDIIILDEVTSLLLYMTSTFKGKEEKYIKNIFAFMSLRLKKFVIADSFIIDFPFKGRTLGIYNNFREKLNVKEYLDKNMFISKIIQKSMDSLISVSSNEKGFLVKTKKLLEDRGKKVILLTADTDEKERDKIYSMFNNQKINCDAILYSPTLTVGVSIFTDIEHHFHYDTSGTVSVIDSIQMTRRTREAKSIHIFIRGKSSFKDTNLKNIKRNLKSFQIIDEWGNSEKLTYTGEKLAELKQIRNILDNTHKYAFKSLLGYQFEVVEIVDKPEKREIKLTPFEIELIDRTKEKIDKNIKMRRNQ